MSLEDIAQEVELAAWERVNRARPERPKFQPDQPGYGPAQCIDCDDEMPDVRRAYGFVRCTECAAVMEKRLGRY